MNSNLKAKLAAIDSFEQYERFKSNTDDITKLANVSIKNILETNPEVIDTINFRA